MPGLPTKSRRISSRITAHSYGLAKKLAARKGTSLSQVLESSIERYCDDELEAGAPWKVLRECGFVAIGAAEPGLSGGYKEALRGILARKHGSSPVKRR